MTHLREVYQKETVPRLMQELRVSNPYDIPRIVKVVLNMGVGKGIEDKSELEKASADLQLIAGQKPVLTRARKSIAGFKIRAGQPVGVKVTLRGKRMYEFLHKLFHVVLPSVRDFHGLSPDSFDGGGNYTIGFSEQTVFHEIDANKVDKLRGLEVVIVTSTKSDEEAERLLRAMGCPLQKE